MELASNDKCANIIDQRKRQGFRYIEKVIINNYSIFPLFSRSTIHRHSSDYLSSLINTDPNKLERSTPQKPFYLQNINYTTLILDHGQLRHLTAGTTFQTPFDLTLQPNHAKKDLKHTVLQPLTQYYYIRRQIDY